MSSEISDILKQLLEGQKKMAEEQKKMAEEQAVIREEQKRLSSDNADLRSSLNITPEPTTPVLVPVATSTPSVTPTVPSNSNVRRRVIQTPTKGPSSLCRKSVRSVYSALNGIPNTTFGYDLSQPFKSEINIATTERLVKAVIAENDGKEKCPYSKSEIRLAAYGYCRTLKEAKNKENKGRTSDHKQKTRRQGRKRERKNRYKKGLRLINWTQDAKEKMETALDYCVSSDESDFEDDVLLGYKAKRLPFLSTKVEKMKKDIFQAYMDSLSRASKDNFRPRVYKEGQFSTREKPTKCPSWVLKNSTNIL